MASSLPPHRAVTAAPAVPVSAALSLPGVGAKATMWADVSAAIASLTASESHISISMLSPLLCISAAMAAMSL